MYFAVGATAQVHPSDTSPPDTSDNQPIVAQVRFEGPIYFSYEELSLRVRTRANRRFLGIPGFTWWLWIHRLGSSGKLGQRIGQALVASGEPPAYLDESVLAADVERLVLLYRQEGFRGADVRARVDRIGRPDRVTVTFEITPGRPTFVRLVQFHGLDILNIDQQLRLTRASLLQPDQVDPESPLQFFAQNQRYSEPVLLEERRRILAFLRNTGYAAIARDSIRAIVFPQSPDSFDITFRIQPGSRYQFGNLDFEVYGPEIRPIERVDTVQIRTSSNDRTFVNSTVRIYQEGQLSSRLLLRTLQFRPGDWYDQSRVLATKRRLDATGVFAFTDILSLHADTTRSETTATLLLPHRFELRTRQRHRIRFETFMLQRSGVLGASDTELGTGLGVSYENTNLLGRGERFQVRTTGSIAADIDSTIFTSAQSEITTSLTYPYLVGPFRRLERTLNLYDARSRLSINYLTARRADLGLVIRGRGLTRFRLEMQHTPTLRSFVDLLDLSLSNPDTLSNFSTDILERLLRPVDDPVQQAQVLEDYTQPQINSAFRYALQSANVNPLRREQGYSYEATIEVGNNLLYLLDRFVMSPGHTEGSLPGSLLFGSKEDQNRLVYRRYVRFVGDIRRYLPTGQNTVLATKFICGIVHPTGQSDVVPFDRRFYSGGASSVRGWRLRTLGPGAAAFSPETDTTSVARNRTVTNILGGDILLEASAEIRYTALRNILAADWIGVLFADAGNVWFGPRNPGFGDLPADIADGHFRFNSFYKEIGLGSGIGLRIAWEYLIIRFDLACKVLDPKHYSQGLFPHGLKPLQPHFGIGHTF